jgi:hypothetical protein
MKHDPDKGYFGTPRSSTLARSCADGNSMNGIALNTAASLPARVSLPEFETVDIQTRSS